MGRNPLPSLAYVYIYIGISFLVRRLAVSVIFNIGIAFIPETSLFRILYKQSHVHNNTNMLIITLLLVEKL